MDDPTSDSTTVPPAPPNPLQREAAPERRDRNLLVWVAALCAVGGLSLGLGLGLTIGTLTARREAPPPAAAMRAAWPTLAMPMPPPIPEPPVARNDDGDRECKIIQFGRGHAHHWGPGCGYFSHD
jgi:hypothetical protein